MVPDLRGKRVFITGASSGIGAATALEFARRGARVALAARRVDRLEEVRAAIVRDGGEALALPCDVREQDSMDAAIAQAAEAFGGLDIVYANAGFGVSGSFASLTVDDYRRQFDTNVFGVITTAKAALPHLVQSRGVLAVTSSVLGKVALTGASAYTSSKFAVCGLCETLHLEFMEQGVAVVCIEPGVIASEFRAVDNQGVHHEGVSEPLPAWIVVPTERAARSIVRAIAKRKPEAIISVHGHVIVFLSRHFPRAWRKLCEVVSRGRAEKLEKARRGGVNDAGAFLP